MQTIARAVACFCLALLWGGCDAAVRWEELEGPHGGGTRLVGATTAGVVYATCGGRLYASSNAGDSWEREPLPSARILDVAVTDACVFAVVGGDLAVHSSLRARPQVLYRSAAGSWVDYTGGLPATWIGAVAAVGYDVYVVARTPETGVWRRRAGDRAWTLTVEGLGGAVPLDVASCGERVYAHTRSKDWSEAGVFCLDSRENVWERAEEGIADRDIGAAVLATSGGELFYASRHGVGYRMRPNDSAWQVIPSTTLGREGMAHRRVPSFDRSPIVSFLGRAYTTQGFHRSGTGLGPYVGVYSSDAASPTWTRHMAGIGDLSANSLLVASTTLLVGCETGVYRTTNGRAWERASTGLRGLPRTRIAARGGGLYVGAILHYAVSPDEGESWVTPGRHQMDGLGFYPGGEGQANNYRTTSAPGSYYRAAEGGVWKTADWGRVWQAAGLQDTDIWWLSLKGGRLFALATDGRLFASEDEARSWRRIRAPRRGARIAAVATSDRYVFAITGNRRIYRAPL